MISKTIPAKFGLTRRQFLEAGIMTGVGSLSPFAAAQLPNPANGPTHIDLLIIGPDVVTFDDKQTVIRDGAIAVKGNAILWIGSAVDARSMFTASNTINASGQIAMPGITDAHFHTASQFLRGIHRTTHRKGPFWKKTLIPFESGLEPDDVYESGMAAYTSMISCGTTCFLEAGGPHPDEMGRAAEEVGIRGRIALTTCDLDGPGGPLPPSHLMTTSQALKENEALVKRWKGHSRVNAWLSLRQMMVTSEELRVSMSHLAEELDTGLHTHFSEATDEIDYAAENYGQRPAEYFARLGIFNQRLHCAHSILLTPSDIDLYAKHDVSACHCAFSNYFVGPHRMLDMIRSNVRVGVGTDGPSWRGTLDLFQVCHYAVLGQSIGYGTPFHASPPIPYSDMLRQACRGGSAAAQMKGRTGTLEVGKLADIVLVQHDDHDQFDSTDPVITLGQNVVGHHVRTVVVDGRVVMKDREFLTVDTQQMRARIRRRLPAIIAGYEKALA